MQLHQLSEFGLDQGSRSKHAKHSKALGKGKGIVQCSGLFNHSEAQPAKIANAVDDETKVSETTTLKVLHTHCSTTHEFEPLEGKQALICVREAISA